MQHIYSLKIIRAKEEYLCMALKNIAFEVMCWTHEKSLNFKTNKYIIFEGKYHCMSLTMMKKKIYPKK